MQADSHGAPGAMPAPLRYETIGSTNDECFALAAKGAPEWTTVLADRQTSGRGRQSRLWRSPPGAGLYTSILLRPTANGERLTLLPLITGIATVEAIRLATGAEARLKWPNDVLMRGRKLAGILVEAASAGSRLTVVVGIGVNIATPVEELPERILYPATSLLQETGQSPDAATLLALIRQRLAHWYALWQSPDTAPLIDAWNALDAFRGRELTVTSPDGEQLTGVDEGIEPNGALRLRQPGGQLTIAIAGDILA